jgi:hypothetical protein
MTTHQIDDLAKRYDVTPRTIFRWIAAGVDVLDPVQVAVVICEAYSTAPIEPISAILSNEYHNTKNTD